MSLLSASFIAFFPNCASAASPGRVEMCITAAEDDVPKIVLPAGTVFDYAGHMMSGNVRDPHDFAHEKEDDPKHNWNVSDEEESKCRAPMHEDDAHNKRESSGFVTLDEAVLTQERPCASVRAAVTLSTDWNWVAPTIFKDSNLYNQIFGFLKGTRFGTDYTPDGKELLSGLVVTGGINARVRDDLSDRPHSLRRLTMPFTAETYRVLIASPSDLSEECQCAVAAINEWNAQHAAAEGAVLLPIMWVRPKWVSDDRKRSTAHSSPIAIFW